eukprot:10315795-Lingulodinium_polyedra.AAC.1
MIAVLRLSGNQAYPSEFRCCTKVFDDALAREYSKLKRAKVSLCTWLSTHMHLANIIIDSSDLQVLATVGEEDWRNHST